MNHNDCDFRSTYYGVLMLDQILDTINDKYVFVLIEVAVVSSTVPAVIDSFASCLIVLEVTLCESSLAKTNLAHLSRSARLLLFIAAYNAQLEAWVE